MYGRTSLSRSDVLLSGPTDFLFISFDINLPTSRTAVGGMQKVVVF